MSMNTLAACDRIVMCVLTDFGAAPATEIRYRRNGEVVVVQTEEPTRVLNELTGRALADGIELEGLEVRRPTLEEIYLSLTEEARVE